MLPRLELPRTSLLVLVAVAFLAPGLVDHDPWKTVDVVAIAIVHGMQASGDWILPRVGGEPWLEDPPLYFWVAGAFAKLLTGPLEFHNAARLASPLFISLALFFTHAAVRRSGGDDVRSEAAAAALLLLGALGLMVHAHEAFPRLALLASVTVTLWATVKPAARESGVITTSRGVALGLGIGASYLSGGPLIAGALFVAAAGSWATTPEWRNRQSAAVAVMAATVASGAGWLWTSALAARHPDVASAWLSAAVAPSTSWLASGRSLLTAGIWFAWPAWLLAGWTLWTLRRRLSAPKMLVPLWFLASTTAAGIMSAPPRDYGLIPPLVPLVILAAAGLPSLRRGAAAALDWFGAMTFAFFAGLVWLGYIGMMTGTPPRVANNFEKLAPGFAAQFEPASLAIAIVLTGGWLYTLFLKPASPLRSVLRWTAGLTLMWGVFATLWLDWADYLRSYRSVATALRSDLPVKARCVASRNVGLSQRAAFYYHANIVMQPMDESRPRACPYVIAQELPGNKPEGPGAGWKLIADAGRPGDKLERFRLYQLTPR